MSEYVITFYNSESEYLCHHGIKGQKWGLRRYQEEDGSLTPEGLERYYGDKRAQKDVYKAYKKMDNKTRSQAVDYSYRAALATPEGKSAKEKYRKAYGDVEKATLKPEYMKTYAKQIKEAASKYNSDHNRTKEYNQEIDKIVSDKNISAYDKRKLLDAAAEQNPAYVIDALKYRDQRYNKFKDYAKAIDNEQQALNELNEQSLKTAEQIAGRYKDKTIKTVNGDKINYKDAVAEAITSKQYEEAKAEKDKEMEKEAMIRNGVDYSKYEVTKDQYGYTSYSGKEQMKDANGNKYDYEIKFEPSSNENEDKSKEIKECEKIFKEINIDDVIDYAIEQNFDVLSEWGENWNLTKNQMINLVKETDSFISIHYWHGKPRVEIWLGNNGLPFIGYHSLTVDYDPKTKKYNNALIQG